MRDKNKDEKRDNNVMQGWRLARTLGRIRNDQPFLATRMLDLSPRDKRAKGFQTKSTQIVQELGELQRMQDEVLTRWSFAGWDNWNEKCTE